MKKFSSIPGLLILASSLALASTAHAKKTCEDTPHPDDNPKPLCSSVDSSSGGSSSGNSSSNSSSKKSRMRANFPLTIASTDGTPATRVGKAKLESQTKRSRTDFRLDVKIKLSQFDVPAADPSQPPTSIDPADATVTAKFTDATGAVTTCDVEFDEIEDRKAEFHLRLRQRGTDPVQDKMGSCADPSGSGDSVIPAVTKTSKDGTVVGTKLDITVSLPTTPAATEKVLDTKQF